MKYNSHILLFGFVGALLLSSCAKPIDACFDYAPANPDTLTPVFFNAACSENASIFSWSFGDGIDTTVNAVSVVHVYTKPGTYTVRLNAKRKDGVTLLKEKPIIEKLITVN